MIEKISCWITINHRQHLNKSPWTICSSSSQIPSLFLQHHTHYKKPLSSSSESLPHTNPLTISSSPYCFFSIYCWNRLSPLLDSCMHYKLMCCKISSSPEAAGLLGLVLLLLLNFLDCWSSGTCWWCCYFWSLLCMTWIWTSSLATNLKNLALLLGRKEKVAFVFYLQPLSLLLFVSCDFLTYL